MYSVKALSSISLKYNFKYLKYQVTKREYTFNFKTHLSKKKKN